MQLPEGWLVTELVLVAEIDATHQRPSSKHIYGRVRAPSSKTATERNVPVVIVDPEELSLRVAKLGAHLRARQFICFVQGSGCGCCSIEPQTENDILVDRSRGAWRYHGQMSLRLPTGSTQQGVELVA
jgi:hypothetical protein